MNKYEIIGIVGEGAYGIVYKAKCKETGEFGKLSLQEASLKDLSAVCQSLLTTLPMAVVLIFSLFSIQSVSKSLRSRMMTRSRRRRS